MIPNGYSIATNNQSINQLPVPNRVVLITIFTTCPHYPHHYLYYHTFLIIHCQMYTRRRRRYIMSAIAILT